MMRKKELRVVVGFETTTDAMRMEKEGKAAGLGGRLIPIPRQITAGCGLAWSEPIGKKEALEALLREKNLSYSLLRELVL